MDNLNKFLISLKKLDEKNIHYTIERQREDMIMALVSVSGERWEIEFSPDNDIEVEIFRSNGDIEGSGSLDRLFEIYGDKNAT